MEQPVPWSVFCPLILALCLIRPDAGRIFVGLLFLVMAVGVNVILIFVALGQFVALGTKDSLILLYRWFFENVVTMAPPLFGLIAAANEIAIALMMLSKGRRVTWGLVGGIVFLVAITPLGVSHKVR